MSTIVAAVHPGDAYYEAVLRAAHRLAAGETFTVLSIHSRPIEWASDPVRTVESQTETARNAVADKIRKDAERLGLSGANVVVPLAQKAKVGDDIVEQAKALDATLMVVGTHGRTGLDAWRFGSVAERVVRLVHCDVYVVRGA